MKINDIIQETTSAGGIATVAAPMGAMQKRPNASVFANTTPKKKKKKKTSEANANQQASLYNPDGKTYRQQPMPHLDDRDPVNKEQDFDSFDDDDLTYDQDLDKDIRDRQRNEKLSKMLDTLKPAERKLIALRYGLDGEDQHSLEDVGKMFGITRERTRQIESMILRKFRHPDMVKDIKDTMPEGKSPHKKGTKKYKKHMAAMHAEATLQTGGYGKPKKSRHQQKI